MTALAAVPVRKIIQAIASAAERWSDGDFPARVRVLNRIVERTGYSEPVVEYALDRLFFPVTQAALQEAIAAELGSLDVLDRFHDNARAVPVGEVCVISSRTTIGVALIPAVFALCAKCNVLVKDREDALIAAFCETLAEELDEFADAARAITWSAVDESGPDLLAFGAVCVFGSDATLETIAQRVSAKSRFIGYGLRASAGYVTRESLDSENAKAIAHGAARDLVLYESQGCLSLHVLFVERDGPVSPAAFTATLANAVERAGIEFPVGRSDPAERARVGQFRALANFRAAAGSGAVFSDEPARYVIVLDPPRDEAPAFLPRTLGVMPVDGPAQALHYLRAHALPLEGFAISSERDDAVRLAVDAGAVRIARFGELQHPQLGVRHGGRPRVADFITWIDKTL